MSRYDPMKDHISGKEPSNKARGRRPSDGQGYTNPDGSHGYVFYPHDPAADRKNRRYRGVIIALSVILTVMFLSLCCLVGAYMSTQIPDDPRLPSEGQETETALSTSGGLVIGGNETVEVTAEAEKVTVAPEVTLSEQPAETESPHVSSDKLPPQREDQDGDGLAEIETDENGNVITSAGKNPLTVATVVNRVAASVVEITAEVAVQTENGGQRAEVRTGSGVIVSAKGLIVTNFRLIEGASVVSVRLSDGKTFVAQTVGFDAVTDLAVLRINAADHGLTVATLGSSFDLVVGESVLSVSTPSGSLSPIVAESMVSATSRHLPVGDSTLNYLQLSAPISPTPSGGALFNLAGELIGIANAGILDAENPGAGFAIPVDVAYESVVAIVKNSQAQKRPALGFEVMEVTSYQISMEYFDSFYVGVFVIDREHETVKYGDLILSVDGIKINNAAELQEIIAAKSVGEALEFVVYRERAKHTVTVVVAEEQS